MLVRSAPAEEATFFSLPYIEELLSLYRHSVLAIPNLQSGSIGPSLRTCVSAAAAGTVASASVRHRLEVERELEERYFEDGRRAPQWASSANVETQRANAAGGSQPAPGHEGVLAGETALALLRYGLARALGFTGDDGPAAAASAGLPSCAPTVAPMDDQLLGRERQFFQCFPTSDEPHPCGMAVMACGYRERTDEALRQLAFLEWFEDLLGFLVARDFSVVQARCILIDTMGLLESLDALPTDAAGAEVDDTLVEMVAVQFLQDAVTAQTCAVPTRIVETTITSVPVTREVPDPDLVSTLEQRLVKERKLSKKQQAAIQAQIAAAPLVSRVTLEEQHVEVEREVLVGPYFTLSEAAVVLDYLTSSVLGRWRLMQYAMTQTQPRGEEVARQEGVNDFRLVMEDTDAYCVPPLCEFFPVAMHDMQVQRHALWQEAETAARSFFAELYVDPIELAMAQEREERTAVKTALEAAHRENVACALTGDQFDRVQRAYNLRLQCRLGGRDIIEVADEPSQTFSATAPATSGGGGGAAAATAAGVSAATASGADEALSQASRPQTSSRSGKKDRAVSGRAGRKGSAAGTAAAPLPPLLAGEPRVAPECVEPLPRDQPFRLPEVEGRIGTVASSLEGLLGDPKLMKKMMTGRGKR